MTALGDGRSGVPIPCWRSTRSAERPFGLPVDVTGCCSVFKSKSWAPVAVKWSCLLCGVLRLMVQLPAVAAVEVVLFACLPCERVNLCVQRKE